MLNEKIMLAARFFERDPAKKAKALARLDGFVRRMHALALFDGIAVAVNVDEDKSDAVNYLRSTFPADVIAIPVTPWGRFVPALSALIEQAAHRKADRIFFASVEVLARDKQAVLSLARHVDEQTLVAGQRLDGHVFSPGIHACTGDKAPWNTVAIWRVKNGLDRIGFPSVGEAYFDQTQAGVEEVGAIAVYQQLYRADCKAKLVDMDGFSWDKGGGSKPAAVPTKMNTKKTRPEAQCAYSQLSPGEVEHLA